MSGDFLSQAAVFWQTRDWIWGALAVLHRQNSTPCCNMSQYSSAEKLSWGFDYLKLHSFVKKSISEEMYKCSVAEEVFSATLKRCELSGWSYLNHALHKHLQADRR